MQSIEIVKGSNGSAPASVATVQSSRSMGATTLDVDTVAGINTGGFAGSMGTPHTFTDPITSEVITVISEATCVDFTGHVDGSNLEIDDIAPGYTDAGSSVGDIIIIRPTTQYADNLAAVLAESLNDDGSIKDAAISDEDMLADNVIVSEAPFGDAVDPVKRFGDDFFDHIASGCRWTPDAAGSTRLASCTAGVVYIGGKRLTVAAVNNRTFTASKDVYCDLKDNGDGTAVWVFYDNTTNAASPTFVTTGGTMRGAIVVVGASNIADQAHINQGEWQRSVPSISSQPRERTDSLGNLIHPDDPTRKILGGLTQAAMGGMSSGTAADITSGLCAILVPTGGRNVTIDADLDVNGDTSNLGEFTIDVDSGTSTKAHRIPMNGTGGWTQELSIKMQLFLAAGLHTIKLKGARVVGSGNVVCNNGTITVHQG